MKGHIVNTIRSMTPRGGGGGYFIKFSVAGFNMRKFSDLRFCENECLKRFKIKTGQFDRKSRRKLIQNA